MSEPVNNNPPPPAVPQFEVNDKDDKEVQALKIKTNATLQQSVIQVSGNQQANWVNTAKGLQVPQ
jgi:hypothetical protein